MEEKRCLKWYNKLDYSSGGITGNMVYAFVNNFVMLTQTDTVGLSAGICRHTDQLPNPVDGATGTSLAG